MKRLLLVLVLATGCSSVPPEVVLSVQALKVNTGKVGASYLALLRELSSPLPEDGETQEASEKRWADHLAHQEALVKTNDTLAAKVCEWALVSSGQDPKEDKE